MYWTSIWLRCPGIPIVEIPILFGPTLLSETVREARVTPSALLMMRTVMEPTVRGHQTVTLLTMWANPGRP